MSNKPAEEDWEVIIKLVGDYVSRLPEVERPAQVERIFDSVANIYRCQGTALPPWLTRLSPDAEAAPDFPPYLHRVESVVASEMIRANLRSAVKDHPDGFVGVARELGVRVRAFRRFMAGEPISAELWSPASAYALNQGCGLPAHGSLGLALVVSDLPVNVRERARVSMAAHLSDFLKLAGERQPGWVEWEVDEGPFADRPNSATSTTPSG
jgi:hypothetical protein